MRIPAMLVLLLSCTALAQAPSALPAVSEPAASASPAAPITITLRDAIERAKANSPAFQRALIQYGIAQQERFQARAGMLPSVTYNNQYLYTEGNGTPTGVFIANNAVHEYVSQADAHEALSLTQLADVRRARAAEELERGREVAHADVVKAQLQYQDQQRDLSSSQLAMEQARLQLAILIFPDFNQDFQVVDNLESSAVLPPKQTVLEMARKNNPDLQAALAERNVAQTEVAVAKAAYLPDLTLDYFYGIDADHFATESRAIPPAQGEVQNLGYSAQATLNIPVWNWGITRSKIRQARLRVQSADVQLQYAQRKLIADFESAYQEAEHAAAQTDLLRNSVSLADESLRLTTLRYKAGESTALEVVSAQDALAQEKNALVDAEAGYATAVAKLQAIAGPF
jgi:outer membrane protein TolC